MHVITELFDYSVPTLLSHVAFFSQLSASTSKMEPSKGYLNTHGRQLTEKITISYKQNC